MMFMAVEWEMYSSHPASRPTSPPTAAVPGCAHPMGEEVGREGANGREGEEGREGGR